jgi:metacaspase-1
MNRALLVGINKYPSPNELNGCVNDVTDMAAFLVSKCGFGHDDIRLLTDQRATAKGILNRLGWLLNGASKGDRILFHYSGHGAQVASRNPQGAADAIDEVICPVDFSFDEPGTMIRDKDFVRIFGSVPAGVEFNWISDSCYSGGLTRAMLGGPAFKVRTFAIPADIAWRNQSALQAGETPLGMKAAAAQLNVALISGCTAKQESADADIGGRYNGAMTYYLLDVLKGAKGLKNPLTGVVKTMVKDLKTAKFTQTPELLGSRTIGRKAFMSK